MIQSQTTLNSSANSVNDIESTLARLSQNEAVKGILILDRKQGHVIKSLGSLFEGPLEDSQNKIQKYAKRIFNLLGSSSDQIDDLIEDGVSE